jgi:DnaJ-class molecular chaperone
MDMCIKFHESLEAVATGAQQPQQAICRECSGRGYKVSLVGDGIGVQYISERKRKCRSCNGCGKQLAVR